MKHASLFSGIGGFDLAAQWMGWENVFQVEIDGFCQKVLAKNFPNVTRYGDIKQFDGTKYRGTIDVLSGGFPCQPFSQAGKRKGTEDERHLWPEMLRIIREIQPAYIVGENVYGLVNWSRGLVFEQIHADLENEGFEVQSFILPACGKDAGHKRYRIWFIAHNNSHRLNNEWKCGEGRHEGESFNQVKSEIESDLDGLGIKRELQEEISGERRAQRRQIEQQLTDSFRRSDSFEPKLCRTLHGLPFGVDRIKSLGNAIVPQVAFEIFKAIDYLRYK